MRVRTKNASALTGGERQTLARLHLHKGTMYGFLREVIEEGQPAKVLIADDGQVAGWGLLDDDLDGCLVFMVYVRRARRREGVGTRLLEKAMSIADKQGKRLQVVVHDEPSEKFYSRHRGLKKEYWTWR